MTAIIALRFEYAACFRRWLFTGRNGACQKWAFEPPPATRASSFAAITEHASTLPRSANDPDRCSRSELHNPVTLSAIAKST